MLIGYARVSTGEQELDLQTDALQRAGCERLFTDRGVSGSIVHKPAFMAALDFARADDVLVVWRLDRLSRSLGDLIALIRDFEARKLGFRSLKEDLNTTTPYGKLIFHTVGAFAEFEVDTLKERTRA